MTRLPLVTPRLRRSRRPRRSWTTGATGEQSGHPSACPAPLPAGDAQAGVAFGRPVDDDLVAVPDVAGQQRLRQLVADRLLHQAAQRPGAVDRVEPVDREPVAGAV